MEPISHSGSTREKFSNIQKKKKEEEVIIIGSIFMGTTLLQELQQAENGEKNQIFGYQHNNIHDKTVRFWKVQYYDTITFYTISWQNQTIERKFINLKMK